MQHVFLGKGLPCCKRRSWY